LEIVLAEFGDRVIVAECHIGDELEIPWTENRSELYDVTGVPTVVFDGKYDVGGASSCSTAAVMYRNYLNQRLAETDGLSPVAVRGRYRHDFEWFELTAVFTLLDTVPLSDARACILLLEDDVYYKGYDPPSGDTYSHVVRAAHEVSVDLITPGDSATVCACLPVDPYWDLAKIKAIAFLQKTNQDSDVVQAYRLPGLSGEIQEPQGLRQAAAVRANTAIQAVWPNPYAPSAGGSVTIQLSTHGGAVSGPMRLDVLDAAGRMVRSIAHESVASDWMRVSWDGDKHNEEPAEAGTYFLRLVTPGGTDIRRLVLIR
jgi:hypothetical protein